MSIATTGRSLGIARAAALGALACVALAALVVRVSHATMDPPHRAAVTAVVRNDLGELKWVAADAAGLTPQEAAGRAVYQRGGCAYCHSQYARPIAADTSRAWGPVSADSRRWGPPAEPGEYALDAPPPFGARGIAPDLSREGLKYSDEWHLAHFWNPQMMTQGSIMGGVAGLFAQPADPVRVVKAAGGRTLDRTPETEKWFDFASKEPIKLTPNADGLLFIPATARGKSPLVWTPNDEFTGDAVHIVAETPEIEALIAYVQKLGMNRGRWRELFEPAEIDGSAIALPRSDAWIAHGKEVYERRCIACHGAEGNGNGVAATFLYKQRPRNFTMGVFKFRLNKGLLPTDADLLRTITRGVRGTAMPAWFELPLEDRLAVMQYVKYVLAVDRSDPKKPEFYFVSDPPGAPITIGTPPAPSAALVAQGGAVWRQAKCWECHGAAGHGDGEKAAGLKDDWGFPIRPANLAGGQFKSGPGVSDIFRTITTGLSGSPMASFQDSFSVADRWALAYYVLSLSAYADPLSAAPLPLSPQDRAVLDDAAFVTPSPERAYGVRPGAAR